jgi:RNA polymerase sigma-70 factor (ECF subfamily)
MAAFTQLVRRHEVRVRSFLARLCGRHEADDLAQETFVQAWRMAAAYRGEGSYRAWLLGIAWRRYLSAARSRRPEALADIASPARQSADDPNAGLDLTRAFKQLAPRERAVALLCFSEGCSHAEAARSLQLPLGTVKSLAARARAQLATHLGGAHP